MFPQRNSYTFTNNDTNIPTYLHIKERVFKKNCVHTRKDLTCGRDVALLAEGSLKLLPHIGTLTYAPLLQEVV